MIPSLFVALFLLLSPRAQERPLLSRGFVVDAPAEVVATITATCARCDWARRGREAVLLEITLDGAYSQHVALTRGGRASSIACCLGRLDRRRSHADRSTRRGTLGARRGGRDISVDFKPIVETDQEFAWIARSAVSARAARDGRAIQRLPAPHVCGKEHRRRSGGRIRANTPSSSPMRTAAPRRIG